MEEDLQEELDDIAYGGAHSVGLESQSTVVADGDGPDGLCNGGAGWGEDSEDGGEAHLGVLSKGNEGVYTEASGSAGIKQVEPT